MSGSAEKLFLWGVEVIVEPVAPVDGGKDAHKAGDQNLKQIFTFVKLSIIINLMPVKVLL